MPKGAISKVMTVDGKQVYVIGSGDGSDGSGAFLFVDTISERDQFVTDKFVFVRQAYKNDPTVNRGWAVYIYDSSAKVHWVKVMEEESVDGPWGVQAEILKSCITKSQFIEYTNKTDAAIAELNSLIAFSKTAHTHSNKDILDELEEKYGQLTYKGRSIAGNSYLYDVVVDGKLMWKDPTDGEAAEVEVTYSLDIATKFAKTVMVQEGMLLDVVETNGAVSTFRFVESDGELIPVFVGIEDGFLIKEVTRIIELPEAGPQYTNGLYEVLPNGSSISGIAGHIYKCVANDEGYEWVDLTLGTSKAIVGVGSTIILACFRETWNKHVVMWKASDESVNVVRTVVVRKIGSAPTSATDGVVVFNDFVTEGMVKDTVPLTKEQVFYGVFQFTGCGSMIAPGTAESNYIDWSTIKVAIENNAADKIFAEGDTVVLKHTKFGTMEFKTIFVAGSQVKLAATKSFMNLEFDGHERGMKLALDDARYDDAKKYFEYKVEDGKETYGELLAGHDYNPGETINKTVYEEATDSTNFPWTETYDPIDGICHGNANWAGSNVEQFLNSDKLAGWFTSNEAKSDLKGASYEDLDAGWLAGIVDTDLRSVISGVRLPVTEDEVIAPGKVWTMIQGIQTKTSGSGTSYTERMLKYRDEDGTFKFAFPEGINRSYNGSAFVNDYLGVAPIIILGDAEDVEQPVVDIEA